MSPKSSLDLPKAQEDVVADTKPVETRPEEAPPATETPETTEKIVVEPTAEADKSVAPDTETKASPDPTASEKAPSVHDEAAEEAKPLVALSDSVAESQSRPVSSRDSISIDEESRRGGSSSAQSSPTKETQPSFERTETSSIKDISTRDSLFKPDFSTFEMAELTEHKSKEDIGEVLVVGLSDEFPMRKQDPLTLADDDPENARNWSRGRVALINFVLCVWVLSLTYGSTAYIASIPTLMVKYRVSQEACIGGISLNVLGFAAGPLIFGPASELYGRRIVYVITGTLFTAFAFGVAFANSLGATLVCRFFVGFFGSAALNNVPASIGDYTTQQTRGPCSIFYALLAFGGPAYGPIASAYVVKHLGSDWNLRIMAIFTGVFSLLAACIPETYGPVLLRWRLQKAGKAPTLSRTIVIQAVKTGLFRPFAFFVTEPLVTAVTIYLGVLYAILYAFFEAFGVVYLEARGFSFTNYGLTYISLAVGFFVGCVLLAVVGQPLYLKAVAEAQAKGTKVAPEARLHMALMAAILSPIESNTSASVLACGTTFRSCLAAAFPLFTLQFYHALGIGGATSLLAGVCLLLAPIPFVFKYKGESLRARSRYAE